MKHAPLTRYANRMDREEVMRVLRAFEVAGLEYVLIGAVDAAALRERFNLEDEG